MLGCVPLGYVRKCYRSSDKTQLKGKNIMVMSLIVNCRVSELSEVRFALAARSEYFLCVICIRRLRAHTADFHFKTLSQSILLHPQLQH